MAELSPGMKSIIITGHASFESAIDAVKRERIAVYEVKPLNMEHILALIKFQRESASRRKNYNSETKTTQETIPILDDSTPPSFLTTRISAALPVLIIL